MKSDNGLAYELKEMDWDEVEIGEVYYDPSSMFENGFVMAKTGELSAIVLVDLNNDHVDVSGHEHPDTPSNSNNRFFKLPVWIQDLFRA